MRLKHLVFGTLLAAILAACSNDMRFVRDGAGIELSWAGQSDYTQLQNMYLGHLCVQAGVGATSESCIVTSERDWALIVQAGLNDIDSRCDAYLTWLDDKRRSAGPIAQQIADIRTATTAILAATGVGVAPLAVVNAAFGLAHNSLTNFQSRLILEVNHSTVQTIVLSAQRRFRAALLNVQIDNRPTAIYALRQYLRICMPFTIETEINTTISAFERGGPGALANRRDLIDASVVRSPVIRSAATPLRPIPATRRNEESLAALGEFEATRTSRQVSEMERIACLPQTGRLTASTRRAILAFLGLRGIKDAAAPDRITPSDFARMVRIDSEGSTCS